MGLVILEASSYLGGLFSRQLVATTAAAVNRATPRGLITICRAQGGDVPNLLFLREEV